MDKLTDYIRWMEDFPIAATGFRHADALVLCMISYYDLAPLFGDLAGPVHVRDCQKMLDDGQAKVLIVGGDMGYDEILRAAAASRRFGDLEIDGYVDILQTDPPVQFSAVTFHDDTDLAFIAYRGTDNSIAGWKEDFMISFTHTQAQELALTYAREHITGDRRWILGGHSKGGNEALYAACMLEDGDLSRVEKVYLLDGPGLCPELDGGHLLERINDRTVRIIPESSVIGRLFEPKVTETHIVKSSAIGILQHSLATWGIDHGRLAEAKENDIFSQWVSRSADQWISGIPLADRTVFVDDLFGTLEVLGVTSFDDVLRAIPEKLDEIGKRLQQTSPLTRKILQDLPRQAFMAGLSPGRKTDKS